MFGIICGQIGECRRLVAGSVRYKVAAVGDAGEGRLNETKNAWIKKKSMIVSGKMFIGLAVCVQGQKQKSKKQLDLQEQQQKNKLSDWIAL